MMLSVDFLNAVIQVAVPYVAAALGEIVSERAGVLNIGLEGLMLTGAFVGSLASHLSGSAWIGLLAAVLATCAVAAVQGVIMLRLAANQVVTGIALNLAALGLTTYLSRTWFGPIPPEVNYFGERWAVPGLGDIPLVGPILFHHTPPVYLVYLLAPVIYILLFQTWWGLAARAAGEQPQAAESAGIPVVRVRFIATLLCGMMAGLAGAHFTLGNIGFFTENITAGSGYIALAVVIASRWHPGRAVMMGLLFGLARALVLRLPSMGIDVPYQLLNMLPYVVTLAVYGGLGGRTRAPAALGVPYEKQ